MLGVVAPAQAAPPPLPLQQTAGPWRSGHVQGIAVDREGGFIYYSFTDLLAKYDFTGRLVGTLSGWTGHLGDLDFNPADGKVYGSLEYKTANAFYAAVIDGARIDRAGLTTQDTDILRAVYLPEVVRDYTAKAPDHRYGCSGIDGLAFGPAFGRTDGPHYLTIAYGIFGDAARDDNDHQVLLQYDVRDWARHARPLPAGALHKRGPARPQGKSFVRTGNTRFGTQNLTYDSHQARWFMGVYPGTKPVFPNYGLFAVEARAVPRLRDLIGVHAAGKHGWERGRVLPLADDGEQDPRSGIRGWHQKADVGLQSLGDGLFYLVTNHANAGEQSASIVLTRHDRQSPRPFAAIELQPPE